MLMYLNDFLADAMASDFFCRWRGAWRVWGGSRRAQIGDRTISPAQLQGWLLEQSEDPKRAADAIGLIQSDRSLTSE